MEKVKFSTYACLLSSCLAVPAIAATQAPVPGAAYQTGADRFLPDCIDFQLQYSVSPSSGFSSSGDPHVGPLLLESAGADAAIRNAFNGENHRREFQNIFLTPKDYAERFASTFEYAAGTLTAGNPAMKVDAANIVDPEQFYAACGNRFVSSATLGGKMQVVSRIEFANATEARKFQQEFPADQRVGHLGDEVQEKLESIGIDAALFVGITLPEAAKAHFLAYLSSRGIEPVVTLTCDVQTWPRCRELLEAATAYSTDEIGGFASQFGASLSTAEAMALASENVQLVDYAVAAGADLDVLSAVGELDVLANKTTIESLFAKYETRQGQRQRITLLQDIFDARLDAEKKVQLATADARLKVEMQHISSVGIACLDGATDCSSRAGGLVLEDVGSAELELPSLEAQKPSGNAGGERDGGGGGSGGVFGMLLLLMLTGISGLRRHVMRR